MVGGAVVGGAAVGGAVVRCKPPNSSFPGPFFSHLVLARPQKGAFYVEIFSSIVLQTEAWQLVSSSRASTLPPWTPVSLW